MSKYRKKPIVIDAFQITKAMFGLDTDALKEVLPDAFKSLSGRIVCMKTYIEIQTREGTMFCDEGDWVIKGIEGEVYGCQDSIFKKTYEKVK